VDANTITYWQRKLEVSRLDGRKNYPRLDDSMFFRPEFWWLIGYLQGDGHVDSKTIACTSIDRELIESVVSLLEELFELRSANRTFLDRRSNRRPIIHLEAFSTELSKWLAEQGFRFGISRWNVPVLPRNFFSSYLAGLLDSEGCVHVSKNKITKPSIRVIEFTSKNRKSLGMIGEKLTEYGIKSRVSIYRSISRLEIYGRENLKWFVDNVGPSSRLPRKRRWLNQDFLPQTMEEMKYFLSNDLAEAKVKVSPEIENAILRLASNGLSLNKIAKKFRITDTTVRRHLTQPCYQ